MLLTVMPVLRTICQGEWEYDHEMLMHECADHGFRVASRDV